jgi:GNAT superfamily N-acetyltransferase
VFSDPTFTSSKVDFMIRTACIIPTRDIALAVELRVEFQELMSGLIPPDRIAGFREANRTHFHAGFADDSVVVFLASVDSGVAGCAMLQEQRMIPNLPVPTGKTGLVLNVMVREAFRRQGVGEALMLAIKEEGWRRGLDRLDLKASEMGEPLYRTLGWGDPKGGKPMEIYRTDPL